MKKFFYLTVVIHLVLVVGCEIKVQTPKDFGENLGLDQLAALPGILANRIPREGDPCDDGVACTDSDVFVKQDDGAIICQGTLFPGCVSCETDDDCPPADTVVCLHEQEMLIRYTGVCPQADDACIGNLGCGIRKGECEFWAPDEYEKCLQ